MSKNLLIPNVECPLDFSDFVKTCRSALIVKSPTPFKYPAEVSGSNATTDRWEKEADRIKELNSDLLGSLRHCANLYAIYKKNKGSDEWDPVYVGHSQSKGMRSRLTAHLVKKDKRTGAMVEKAAEAIRNGAEIAVSFILVAPEELRLVAENKILANDIAENEFQWNTNGRAS